jgi:hypothetical protein
VILDEAVQRVRAALDANGEGFRDVDHLLREEGSVQKFVEHVLRRAADGTSPPSGGRRGVKHVE